MNRAELMVFKANDHWTISFNRENHGSYQSRADALKVARTWAENARLQGHTVELIARDESGGIESSSYRPDSGAIRA